MRFLFYRWLFFFGNSVCDRCLRVILQDMGTPEPSPDARRSDLGYTKSNITGTGILIPFPLSYMLDIVYCVFLLLSGRLCVEVMGTGAYFLWLLAWQDEGGRGA